MPRVYGMPHVYFMALSYWTFNLTPVQRLTSTPNRLMESLRDI